MAARNKYATARHCVAPALFNLIQSFYCLSHYPKHDIYVAARSSRVRADFLMGYPCHFFDFHLVAVRHKDFKLDCQFEETFIVSADRHVSRDT